jgi:aminoglycoside/choline kinase family phosphotransferase
MKFKILPIAGDASFRTFYRLASNKSSKIIVLVKKEKYKNLIAYSAINKFLVRNKILAPNLYTHNFSKGIIVIEDFGDISFHKVLIKQKKKLTTYKKLIDLLLKIQKIKPKSVIKNIIDKPYVINKYSNKYLHKESDLFFDWYLPLFLNKKKVLSIKKKTKKILSLLYSSLNFSNSYFVHRDYHVQNLMKVGKKIGVIDSQDALIGNPAYDLVSLIDDVRIRTSKKLKDKIYSYYLKKTSKIYRINSKKFLEDFNTLSVQRSLKIIGIFSRLFKRDKKNKYLKLIPYTWQLLEMRMGSETFSKLKEILDRNINKKIRKKIIYK